MSGLCRGRIVWVELADPQNRNPKCRPAVIVTANEDIREDGEVWVVGISTQLEAAPADVQVDITVPGRQLLDILQRIKRLHPAGESLASE